MILKDTNQARQFLPSLNLTLTNDRFNDFFRRSQQWLVEHIIGDTLEAVLEAEINLTQTDSHAELRLACQRVIAEKALLDAIPEMDMQLTEAGFAVQNNDDFAPASAQRVDRLVATLPGRIAVDVDSIVRYLLKNSNGDTEHPQTYDSWRNTDQYRYLTAAFIPLFEQYNMLGIPPMKSYDDFYNAIPLMAKELKKVAAYYVSAGEIDRLLELFRNGETLQIHREAIADLKGVAAAAYNKDIVHARNYAICARCTMLSAPDYFPEFKASDASKPITANLDGGKTVNFL